MLQSLGRRYAWYVLGWTVIALFFFSQSLSRNSLTGDPTPWWALLTSTLLGVYITGFLTPVILWPNRHWPIQQDRWPIRVALHVALSVMFSVVLLAAASAINSAFGLTHPPLPWLSDYRLRLIRNFHAGVFLYWLLVGGDYALRYVRGYREKQTQALRLELREAQLRRELASVQLAVLKAQIQPHFLFNTLNSAMVLVRTGRVAEAERTLGLLSDLLRLLLQAVSEQEVSLHHELRLVELYLAIEKIRFGDRLQVAVSATPESVRAAVPHLGLQPLVENAIRHGLEKSAASRSISVNALRDGESLQVEIRDSGPGISLASNSAGSGIGLSNLRMRLAQLYGDKAQLMIQTSTAAGTIVTLRLPFHEASACA